MTVWELPTEGAETGVRSPLTGSSDISLVAEVPTARLQRFYRGHLGVDIDRFVGGRKIIHQYRCNETGYEFYWPLSVVGDDEFYDALSAHEWYYDEDRWEHREAVEWLVGSGSVLDVGCGSGAFLAKVRERWPDTDCTGLELSAEAVVSARRLGLDVTHGSLEQHVSERPGAYDVVTAFQVLEHVPEPRRFLDGLVAALSPGGMLIIGVPNNDGYVGLTDNLLSYPLNMPPHHMGLWRPSSLEGLTRLLPLEVERMDEEPLDDASQSRLAYSRVARALGDGRLAGLAWRLHVHTLYAKLRQASLRSVPGHTILVAYRRKETE